MNVNCFRLNQDRFLEQVTSDVVAARQSEDAGDYWIAIEESDPRGLRRLLEALRVDPGILEKCMEQGSRLIDNFDTGFRIRVPMCVGAEEDETRYLAVVSVPGILVTISDDPVPSLQDLARQLLTHVRLHASTTAALLHHVLGAVFEDHVFKGLETRSQAAELEDTLDGDIDMVEVRELLSLKKRVGRLNGIFQEQGFLVAFLHQFDSPAFRVHHQRRYYRALGREIQQAIHATENLDTRLRDMHQHHQLASQEKTNRKLSILTVIQAIFVPLTLIAGIYGMNFRYMPELQWGNGYWMTLAVMGLIAITELLLFWRLRWFD